MGIKKSLEERGLKPRKRWGQNFITDPRILESIVAAGDVTPNDLVLEIGPGMGHLTRVLARHGAQVVSVEIDPDLTVKLRQDLSSIPNVQIVQGDILTRPPADWITQALGGRPTTFKVIANIPYYITSAILRHVLEAAHRPSLIVLMVQREVAQRMLAKPPEMNLLAVSVQFFARPRIVRVIAPGAFFPRPKVESAVVKMEILDHPPLPPQDLPRFFELVHAGFGEKRKQLRNSLARGLKIQPDQAVRLLLSAHIDPTRRAETLNLDEWGVLYRQWARYPIADNPSYA